MKSEGRTNPVSLSAQRLLPWRTLLMFVLFGLYVWLQIEPHLIYHNQSTIFAWGWEFAREYIRTPGEPIRYLAAFLSLPSANHSWAGAIIITLTAWGICMVTRFLLLAMGAKGINTLHLLPALFLLRLHNNYQHPLLLDLTALLALSAALLYIRIPVTNFLSRALLFWVGCLFLYYVGTYGYILFALVCGLYEIIRKARWILGASHLLLSHLTPCLFGMSMLRWRVIDAYKRLLPQDYGAEVPARLLIFWLLVPALVLAIWIMQKLQAKKKEMERRQQSHTKQDERPAEAAFLERLQTSPHRWIVYSLVLTALGAGWAFATFQSNIKTLVEIDRFAQIEDWQRVLTRSRELPVSSITLFSWHDTNRALFHTGQMAYRMFEYPQSDRLTQLLPPEELTQSMHNCLKFSDLFFELGLVSDAEHLAYEALSSYGVHPLIFKRLVQTNTLKGKIQAAREFLNVLERFPLEKNWVRNFRSCLDTDPMSDPVIKRISPIMLREDYAGQPFRPDTAFPWLLQQNRANKMAFEYFMASLLLSGQFEELVKNIGRLNDMNYPEIPTNYEEAILIYIQSTGDQHPNLRGRRIRPETIDRFRTFNIAMDSEMKKNKGIPEMALALERDFGGTYWFYCAFVLEMAKHGDQAQTTPQEK